MIARPVFWVALADAVGLRGCAEVHPFEVPGHNRHHETRLADRPARLNARVNANAVVLILALASSMGADGSKAESPQLKLLAVVKMLSPLGMGQ